MPEKLIHRGVETAGEHDEFSTERKHPVFFVDLPTRNVSMTIGGLTVDLSPTKHVVMLLLAAVLCCVVLITAARAHQRHVHAPGSPRSDETSRSP